MTDAIRQSQPRKTVVGVIPGKPDQNCQYDIAGDTTEEEHLSAAGLTAADAQAFLDALAAFAQPVTIHYSWRPQLSDPADEMVLETAVNGQANALVTFNQRDFGKAPGQFGIELLLPSEALRRSR
ncbi:PIN domain-containing protein [Algiphilus sp. W345]|uniref:PIN domain-containing protein n=1 Tax=Banduia mediterranea TaxID=3075609 RepID=A0ABU2WLH4_9GAMM|nr:PIN domain-containing protein [Algiphilus sp. W345]MDT0497892.1 PIN domain-containing protein [Algiphilus sp. W345]